MADETHLPVGLLSVFSSSRWAANQGKRAQSARSKIGYAAQFTHSHRLILAGIQVVPCGG